MSVSFVADLCTNHMGSWPRALALIQAAKDVGCDAVKFQLARHDKLWAPEVRASKEHLIPYELPLEWLPEIRKVCDELGLKFGCTPLYLEAVKELEPRVDFYKIASYEATWVELITSCLETRKPLVISVGLIKGHRIYPTIGSRDWAIYEPELTLLHSASKYPTLPSECNLKRIGELKSGQRKTGYSDHSVNPRVIERAVLHWGAEMVEFHLDLGMDNYPHWYPLGSPGPEHAHSWTPDGIKPVIEFCRVDDGVWPGWEEERKWQRGKDGLRPTEEARK